MAKNTLQILKVLHVLAWIVFVGVCIDAGGLVVNVFYSLFNPEMVQRLYQQLDLSALVRYSTGHYWVIAGTMIAIALAKAILFYLIVTILHGNKLNMTQPFNHHLGRFVSRVSGIALLIGLLCAWGARYTGWLTEQGVAMPDIQQLRFVGADIWVFMSMILFVIAQVFKRGIEMQQENELTI